MKSIALAILIVLEYLGFLKIYFKDEAWKVGYNNDNFSIQPGVKEHIMLRNEYLPQAYMSVSAGL